jgi:hypothetical protein
MLALSPQGLSLSNGIYTSLNYPGALYTHLYGINDAGTIVGSYENASGGYSGFIATPVPVPASLLLLGPGLVGLAALRRRLGK